MNKLKIPKQFEIGGRTVKVKFIKKMADNDSVVGYAKYRQNLIEIQENVEGTSMPYDRKIETFYHELVHWILCMMDEDEKNNDKYVSIFSQYLHQILKTSVYE